MRSAHDILRDRLHAQAGIADAPTGPVISLAEIFKTQWSNEFEAYMRNRLAMGYFRYGALNKQIGCHKYNNVASMLERIDAYKKDNNREHLVDIANLCLVEFAVNPDKPFNAVDDGIHTQKKK